ncbi:MAG: hypothetical protein ACI97P_002472 [Arcticibacterium sp.]|jgi:hypothetical protein
MKGAAEVKTILLVCFQFYDKKRAGWETKYSLEIDLCLHQNVLWR